MVVFRYLEERNETLWRALRERFEQGMLRLTDEQEFGGRLRECRELIDLSLSDIDSMYGIERETEKGADATTLSGA